MAITKQLTFEGLTYNLDDRDRVAADAWRQSGGHQTKGVFKEVVQLSGSGAANDAFSLVTWGAGGATGSLTEADHAGRITYAPDFYIDSILRIPAPSRAGITYQIVSSGVVDDAQNLVIHTSAQDGSTFSGGILALDENLSGAAQTAVVYPGGDDDMITLTAPHNYNLTFVATSTTNYLVSGWVVSDTVTAFSDQP